MLIFFLAYIILWSTPACSKIDDDTPPSSPKANKKEQIDHTHYMVSDIGNLYLSDSFSDVVLVVDEARLPAHRVVLASRSEYFRVSFYGKFKKPNDLEVTISDAPVTLIKIILKYIYTGRINLSALEGREIFELLKISDFYGISNLKNSLHGYLQKSINIGNVCSFLAMTRFFQNRDLEDETLNFIDSKSLSVLRKIEYLSFSSDELQEILHRDTFYAKELFIFRAVCRWIKTNQDTLDRDTKIKVLSVVRYPLMSSKELSDARKSKLVSWNIISDAIKFRNTWSTDKPRIRAQLRPNENLLSKSQVILVTYHTDNDTFLIRLEKPSTINYIEFALWYKHNMDHLKDFSYYIEVSLERHDWTRVVDHSNYNCRSIQRLFIHPRIVQYIQIVGTKLTANATFTSREVKYNTEDMHKVEIKNGLIVPKYQYNVTSYSMNAFVTQGESEKDSQSLLKVYHNKTNDVKIYTYHLLEKGCIVVQLAQPYILGSMRLLLWDGDDRAYGYTVEASVNNQDWEILINKSKELTQSWQVFQFKPRPIIYIRVTGVYSSVGNDFRIVYLEAPAQVTLDSNDVEDDRAITSDRRPTKRLKLQ
ncbi:BTB/POZ domain-containing protein 9-like [Adelges cooleyi]|uniref:BTB/POZ domain-containing protein 9-like n=1 Tax=Adelges cooleyi TaxID=133065 RepID=UPI002180914E|nr:BTB/POZ domain-containing protein 9-like [Adelges cooleyi]